MKSTVSLKENTLFFKNNTLTCNHIQQSSTKPECGPTYFGFFYAEYLNGRPGHNYWSLSLQELECQLEVYLCNELYEKIGDLHRHIYFRKKKFVYNTVTPGTRIVTDIGVEFYT